MATDSLDVDRRRLVHAWTCILPTYFGMCVEHSRDNGAGISIFRMISNSGKLAENEPNCNFHYVVKESTQWEAVLTQIPNRDNILKVYDSSKHVLVSVHIPAVEGQDMTVGNIRMFETELKDGNLVEVEVE